MSQTIELDKTTFDMVETTAYFEAYRHVLQGLKEVDPERIPFKVDSFLIGYSYKT